MAVNRHNGKGSERMKYLKQLAYIFLICIAGQIVSGLIGGVVPGNVLAMVILFLMLSFKVIRLESVAETADFMLANMAFLFVPATVSVFCDYQVFAGAIVKLLVVCLITTILTSLSAGLTVKYVLRLQKSRRDKVVKQHN